MGAYDNLIRSTNLRSHLRCPSCKRAMTAAEIIERFCDECDREVTPEQVKP